MVEVTNFNSVHTRHALSPRVVNKSYALVDYTSKRHCGEYNNRSVEPRIYSSGAYLELRSKPILQARSSLE
jgi:hypothetical protein